MGIYRALVALPLIREFATCFCGRRRPVRDPNPCVCGDERPPFSDFPKDCTEFVPHPKAPKLCANCGRGARVCWALPGNR